MPRPYVNPKRLNNYEAKAKHKRKLEKLADESANNYPTPAIRVDKDRNLTRDRDETLYVKREYRRDYSSSNKFLKRRCSKKARHYKGELGNGCSYKKTFDYLWELT